MSISRPGPDVVETEAASEHRAIWRHGRLYALGNLFARFGGLLLIPLYTKLLTPDAFGVYALLVTTSEFLTIIVGLEIGNAMAQSYFEASGTGERNRVISTSLLAFGATAIFLLLVSYPLALSISQLLFGGQYILATMASIFNLAFSTLYNIGMNYFRILKRSKEYIIISIVKMFLLILSNLFFLLALDLGVAGIFLGLAIVSAASSLFLLVWILREVGVTFSLQVVTSLARVAAPFVPSSLLDTAVNLIERYLLNALLWTGAVGIYSLALRLAQTLPMFLTAPFNQIWVVRRLELRGEAGDRTRLANVFLYFTLVMTTIALAVSLLAPEIVRVIATPAYDEAARCAPLLALAFTFAALRINWEIVFVEEKRTILLPMVSGAALFVGAALGAGLIWVWGLVGAAVATALTQLFRLLFTARLSLRVAPDQPPLPIREITAALAGAVLVYLISILAFGTDPSVVHAAAKTALVAGFATAVFFSPIVPRAERRAILSHLRRRLPWPRGTAQARARS